MRIGCDRELPFVDLVSVIRALQLDLGDGLSRLSTRTWRRRAGDSADQGRSILNSVHNVLAMCEPS